MNARLVHAISRHGSWRIAACRRQDGVTVPRYSYTHAGAHRDPSSRRSTATPKRSVLSGRSGCQIPVGTTRLWPGPKQRNRREENALHISPARRRLAGRPLRRDWQRTLDRLISPSSTKPAKNVYGYKLLRSTTTVGTIWSGAIMPSHDWLSTTDKYTWRYPTWGQHAFGSDARTSAYRSACEIEEALTDDDFAEPNPCAWATATIR